jgi:galactosylceramidase
VEPNSIYSLSTTTGQQKGSFENIPAAKPFPFPYYETFDEYSASKQWGCLPRYTADIAGAFEITDRPGKKGKCLRQGVPVPPLSWAPEWLPYTILGDDQWQDYEVSADVYLNPGDSAAVMGRVNDVGYGYGSIPKGYFLQLADNGQCRLVIIRGKVDKKKVVGDAEQQALIKAGADDGEGGEKILGTIQLPNVSFNQWHNLKLRFAGSTISALVDAQPVLTETNNLYTHGMAGLMAGGDMKKLSTPYFDNVMIKAPNTPDPDPTPSTTGQSPMYPDFSTQKTSVFNP